MIEEKYKMGKKMCIRPIEKKEVSEEVFEQLKYNIISGVWPSGTKIPSELELTRLFNVSRVSVREAIHRLVGMGVLNVKKGEGTYVAEIAPYGYFSSLLPILMIERPALLEVLEFRSIIESESARLAARRASEEDIKILEEMIEQMKQRKGDYEKFSKSDLSFHAAIAMATKNSIIVKITSILHDILEAAMEEAVKIVGFDDGIYYHTLIVESIKARNEEKAFSIMREHIDNVIRKFDKKENNMLHNI